MAAERISSYDKHLQKTLTPSYQMELKAFIEASLYL